MKDNNSSKRILQQIQSLLDQLNGQGTIDLVGKLAGNEATQVMLTIDRAYLGDPSLSDIIDGQYTVLGKVVRALPSDSQESLDLLRKNALGVLQPSAVKQMLSSFQGAEQSGLKLPVMITELKPPAIQVLPIAIFA